MSIVMHALWIHLRRFDIYMDPQVYSPDLCRISSPPQCPSRSSSDNSLHRQNISKYYNQMS